MSTASSANPIFARLTHHARWPSLRTTLVLTIGLSLVSTLLVAYWLSRTENLLAIRYGPITLMPLGGFALPPVMMTFLMLPGALLVLTPIAVTLAAIIVTAREVGDKEAYQLLRLALKPQAIVHGLMLAALHRVRILLALTFALMPFLAVSPYQDTQRMAHFGCYKFITPQEADVSRQKGRGHLLPTGGPCTDPSDSRFLAKALFEAVGPAIISWGISLFGLALGVGLTLWWRRAFPVVLFLATVTLFVCAVLTLLGPNIESGTSWCIESGCGYLAIWPPRITDQLGVVIPYILAGGFTLLARRWA